MATETEWREAYDYLIGRLRELGAEDVIREIAEAAVMPVRRSPATGEQLLLSKKAKRELGQAALEAPTARDRFHATLLILESRLVHLPAVLSALRYHFEDRVPRFVSEYGADLKVEDSENSLIRETSEQLTASSGLRLAVDSLMRLYD